MTLCSVTWLQRFVTEEPIASKELQRIYTGTGAIFRRYAWLQQLSTLASSDIKASCDGWWVSLSSAASSTRRIFNFLQATSVRLQCKPI